MSWDAPAQRALRSAQALFAASDLGWFDALGAPWSGDPWAAFDGLIREMLTTTEGGLPAPPTDEPVLPAVAPLRRPARVVPVPLVPPRPGTTTSMSAAGMAALPMAPKPLLDPPPPRELAPAAAPTRRPAVGRAARVAALAAMRTPAVAAELSLPALENAAAMPARLGPDTLPIQPPTGAGPALPAFGARILRLPETPRAAGAAGDRGASIARPRLALRRVEPMPAVVASASAAPITATPSAVAGAEARSTPGVATPYAVTEAAAPRRTRLVDGLPTLRGLLQAAVAESHRRQVPGAACAADTATPVAAADTATPVAATVPPAPAPFAEVAPLRALPQLDAVAEDMLVDRIADRLQERLREQALRQFGFTGGLN